MNKRKTYIVPAILEFFVDVDTTILAGSGNVVPGDGSGGIDVDINPDKDGEGEDAGDAY